MINLGSIEVGWLLFCVVFFAVDVKTFGWMAMIYLILKALGQ